MMTKAPINADKKVIAAKDAQPVMLPVLAWVALCGSFLVAWFLMAWGHRCGRRFYDRHLGGICAQNVPD